ncbi:MAG: TRAP transporter small permease [Amaricoccus sp.]|uniref:TRAP transporter small permease n=1 Tax=Amaricoccus sp. TaxID=1872485 RepID=UPI0039E40ED0
MGRIINRLEDAALAIAVVCVVFLMLAVSYDAASRYLFNHPQLWVFDVVRYYVLIATVYLAVSATFRHGDHIQIELFRDKIPKPLRARLDAVWSLLAALAFAVMAYGAYKSMGKAIQRNQFLPGDIVWPAWISYLPIALGCGLMTLRMILHAVRMLVHGRDEDVSGEHGEFVE